MISKPDDPLGGPGEGQGELLPPGH
jgi:hypothetical protein